MPEQPVYDRVDRAAAWLARAMAIWGGAILLGVVALTCVSIAGRALVAFGIGPGSVRGIYDYTEIAMAGAVFAFLPWCQYARGHATVDLLAPLFPRALNRLLDVVFDALMCALAFVLAWRLGLGMLDKYRYDETTQIAQVPLVWGYALSLVGAVAAVAVAAFCLWRSGRGLTGRCVDAPHV